MALEQHQRPTAMLLRDPYAGHRDSITGEPDGLLNEWTSWDFALATAVQNIIDGTTEEGHLIWEVTDDRVQVDATKEINKAKAVIDKITGGDGYKPEPGEWWRTTLTHPWHESEVQQGFAEGEFKWRTRKEWIQDMIEDEDEDPSVE